MAGEARGRREAIRQLAVLRRRLAAAEETLADALAAMKSAEGAFDAASDRFDAAERALDAAREDRAQARRDRYVARQAHERASMTADRLAGRVRELAERLDRMTLTGIRSAEGHRSGAGWLFIPPFCQQGLFVGLTWAHRLEGGAMTEARRKFDQNFKENAVRLVREKGQPIAQVARDLGINVGTLGAWVNADKRRRGDGAVSEDERAELDRLRLKNTELVMELDRLYMENAMLANERDALRRSVALWVSWWRTGRS